MNSENNNDLNAISLGSVDNSNNLNTNPVGPVPPVAPVVNEDIPSPIGEVTSSAIASNIMPPIETPVEPVSPVEPVEPVAPVEPVSPLTEVINEPVMDSTVQGQPTNNDIYSSIPNNNIGTVPPIGDNNFNVPTPPVATMPSIPVEPVAPVEPLPYDIPDTINNISSVPVFNDIGTVPPIPDVPASTIPQKEAPKKKKGINKMIFVLIILVAMAAVGVGVYMFLHISSSKASPVITKKVEIEIGNTVSSLITDYATFKGIDSSNCSLNITEITDTTVLNKEYPFTVTCNDKVYKGTAKIVDTVKPEVELKNVNVSLNTEVKAEDFIATCKDSTKCSYEFINEKELKEHLNVAGSYEVPIKVKDEADNEIEVKGNLTVTENNAELYLVCTKGNDTLSESNKLGINNNKFNKFNTRTYTFKLSSEEYTTLKTESTGKTEVTYEDLNKEANTEIPLEFAGLKAFYTEKGYTCNPVY